jgi:hypothetical protein
LKLNNLHKSNFSGGGENCVYQGISEDASVVGVRDSKVGLGDDSLTLTASPEAWASFVGFAVQQ